VFPHLCGETGMNVMNARLLPSLEVLLALVKEFFQPSLDRRNGIFTSALTDEDVV